MSRTELGHCHGAPRVHFYGEPGIGTEVTVDGQHGVIVSMSSYGLEDYALRYNFDLDDGTHSGFAYCPPPGSHVCVAPDSGEAFTCHGCGISWEASQVGAFDEWKPAEQD